MTRPSALPAQNRKPFPLTTSVEKNLASYALAAGSAGVALLACVQPAAAEIVATKTDLTVNYGTPVQIDINNDGQMDFTMSKLSFLAAPSGGCTTSGARMLGKHRQGKPPLGCGFFSNGFQIVPVEAANEVWQSGTDNGHKCAADVRRGQVVGPAKPFAAGPMLLTGYYGSSEGIPMCLWTQPHHPYLGVKFTDKQGQVHYGWVRVLVQQNYSPVIQEYAYETIPNRPIPAGITNGASADASAADPLPETKTEVASLGRLAQGASGIPAWRRDLEPVLAQD